MPAIRGDYQTSSSASVVVAANAAAPAAPSCPIPSCQALIEKLPAVSSSVPCTCGAAGNGSAAVAAAGARGCRCEHKALHRYRCAACQHTFCDACRTSPYHDGLTCEEAAAPHCPLCDAVVLGAAGLQTASLSNRELRDGAVQLGMDCSWCLERSELVAAFTRAKQVGVVWFVWVVVGWVCFVCVRFELICLFCFSLV